MIVLDMRLEKSKKGAIQLDYIIALGLFILMLNFMINYMTNFVTVSKESLEVVSLRSKASTLIKTLADYETTWNSSDVSSYPENIGLKTKAYWFFVLVNNTEENLKTGGNVTSLTNELVRINFTLMNMSPDLFSAVIYDSSRNLVTYDTDGNTIIFNVDLDINESKWFEVFIDDDSNFTDNTGTVSTALDNITETIYPLRYLDIIQYRKIEKLNSSNASPFASKTGIDRFFIELLDSAGNQVFNFSTGDIPERADVIALEKAVVYQNSTAGIEKGKLKVYTW